MFIYHYGRSRRFLWNVSYLLSDPRRLQTLQSLLFVAIRDSVISNKVWLWAGKIGEVALWRVMARAYNNYEMPLCSRISWMSRHHLWSRPQEVQCILLRINPTSFRNWIPVAWSLNRNVRKVLFTSPQYPSESPDNLFWGCTACRIVYAATWGLIHVSLRYALQHGYHKTPRTEVK